jgi:hypothetical protein
VVPSDDCRQLSTSATGSGVGLFRAIRSGFPRIQSRFARAPSLGQAEAGPRQIGPYGSLRPLTCAVSSLAGDGIDDQQRCRSHIDPSDGAPSLQQTIEPVQYRVRAHPPPCGDGFDLSARDGLCYPNGFLRPQDQAARQYQGYRGGRYPVPCGNGADVDSREGQCYPNGTVPPQFKSSRTYPLEYGGGRAVPCGHGADIDIRDGLCYPTGAVPRRFQQGRLRYERRDGYYVLR